MGAQTGGTVRGLQAAVDTWQSTYRPHHGYALFKAAKVAEEAGEALGAILKMEDGRRTLADVRSEIGDTLIALCGLAAVLNLDLTEVGLERYEQIKGRTDSKLDGAP